MHLGWFARGAVDRDHILRASGQDQHLSYSRPRSDLRDQLHDGRSLRCGEILCDLIVSRCAIAAEQVCIPVIPSEGRVIFNR